jgi:hypothetical protein
MKAISLRTLMREPRKVKRMTAGGKSVQVTDHGEPLWVLTGVPATAAASTKAERDRLLDEIFDEMLSEKPSGTSAVRLLEESRR